ncbi:hypothetical protein EIK56_23035 [Sphingomonas sp. C8-2]|jgi:hypothetical protein|nr:hypothetical protein EIK56_23035 [Sphingomonas sp. C8-2]
MAIWQVEIFNNPGDAVPSKRGFVEAATDGEAAEIVIREGGFVGKANLDPVVKKMPTIPEGIVLWDIL